MHFCIYRDKKGVYMQGKFDATIIILNNALAGELIYSCLLQAERAIFRTRTLLCYILTPLAIGPHWFSSCQYRHRVDGDPIEYTHWLYTTSWLALVEKIRTWMGFKLDSERLRTNTAQFSTDARLRMIRPIGERWWAELASDYPTEQLGPGSYLIYHAALSKILCQWGWCNVDDWHVDILLINPSRMTRISRWFIICSGGMVLSSFEFSFSHW